MTNQFVLKAISLQGEAESAYAARPLGRDVADGHIGERRFAEIL